MPTPTNSQVRHINPDGLHKNPAFTQAVVVSGPAKTIYVGGQDAVDASGRIVGPGDIGRQTEQVLTNLQVALEASGARLEDIVKWDLHVVQGRICSPGLRCFNGSGVADPTLPP